MKLTESTSPHLLQITSFALGKGLWGVTQGLPHAPLLVASIQHLKVGGMEMHHASSSQHPPPCHVQCSATRATFIVASNAHHPPCIAPTLLGVSISHPIFTPHLHSSALPLDTRQLEVLVLPPFPYPSSNLHANRREKSGIARRSTIIPPPTPSKHHPNTHR